MVLPIYLDYAATTPLDPRVGEVMQQVLNNEDLFGNPSSQHFYGQKARNLVEEAREKVAKLINANPQEIIFTSGATEANNLALKGISRLYRRKGNHLITVKTEHKAVLDVCYQLNKEGFEVTFLTPEANGRINFDELKASIKPTTLLISIMHVNNETGIMQDIQQISELAQEKKIFFHVDAAQSAGKTELNLDHTAIDLLSLSAHKLYGPKGIGALYLRAKPRIRVEPLLHGGGHEQGMRSGTLATHQIVGMGEAYALAQAEMLSERERITALRDLFIQKLSANLDVILNTDIRYAVPHILNLQFKNQLATEILAKVPQLAASTVSACQGREIEGSYVLRAMGLSSDEIQSSIRFSFGRFLNYTDIEQIAARLAQI